MTSILTSRTHFYPRSPCGERQHENAGDMYQCKFLSTLSLRRATAEKIKYCCSTRISIHALLAESDYPRYMLHARGLYFYPRSPCGERRRFIGASYGRTEISIHALLAESDPGISVCMCITWPIFLSTLSLRRATDTSTWRISRYPYFYPRSPCGERRCPYFHCL